MVPPTAPNAAGAAAAGVHAATAPLRRRALARVGHMGAGRIAPGNTLASFDAARRAGVDMLEFDVLPERPDGTGRLLLAHDYAELARRQPLTLDQGLAHLCQDAWSDIALDVDLKRPGYESRVVAALRAHGLAERALISSTDPASLRTVRALAPEIRLGLSIPRLRPSLLRDPFHVTTGLLAARCTARGVSRSVATALDNGAVDAVMVHWAFVSRRLVRAVAAAGAELYVWTVDNADRIARLHALGVTGIVTNDPRLFAAAAI